MDQRPISGDCAVRDTPGRRPATKPTVQIAWSGRTLRRKNRAAEKGPGVERRLGRDRSRGLRWRGRRMDRKHERGHFKSGATATATRGCRGAGLRFAAASCSYFLDMDPRPQKLQDVGGKERMGKPDTPFGLSSRRSRRIETRPRGGLAASALSKPGAIEGGPSIRRSKLRLLRPNGIGTRPFISRAELAAPMDRSPSRGSAAAASG